MKMLRISVIAFCVLVVSPESFASVQVPNTGTSSHDNFTQYIKRMRNIQADFIEVIKSDKKIILEASGKMAIERPGKFRWDTTKPNHQLIIADGKTLWVYDADLDQVNIKQQYKALKNSPALFLSDPDNALFNRFTITEVASDEFLLTPKVSGSHFSHIKLTFKHADLASMQLSDELGQETYLKFNHVVINSKINATAFSFIMPHGVDIIRE